jgi:hypothetical protein
LLRPEELPRLQEQQKAWIVERDRCSDNAKLVDCIERAYEKRQRELAEIRAAHIVAPKLDGNPKFKKTSRDGKVVFFDKYYFDAYDRLSEMQTRIREATTLTNGEGAEREVKTCSDFIDTRSKGYDVGPGGAEDFNVCDLLEVFRNVQKPAAHLDQKILLGKLWLHVSAELGGVGTGINITAGKPRVDGMGFAIEEEGTSESVRVIALSDFNGDGREDALLLIVHAHKGAAHWYYNRAFEGLTLENGRSDFSTIMSGCGFTSVCSVDVRR